MRTVRTTNSVYEISGSLIRRVKGVNDPTERQGIDGEWQTYARIEPHFGGLLIIWGANEDGSARCTWTSEVLEDTEE